MKILNHNWSRTGYTKYMSRMEQTPTAVNTPHATSNIPRDVVVCTHHIILPYFI